MGLYLNWITSYDTNEKDAKMQKTQKSQQNTQISFFYKLAKNQKGIIGVLCHNF